MGLGGGSVKCLPQSWRSELDPQHPRKKLAQGSSHNCRAGKEISQPRSISKLQVQWESQHLGGRSKRMSEFKSSFLSTNRVPGLPELHRDTLCQKIGWSCHWRHPDVAFYGTCVPMQIHPHTQIGLGVLKHASSPSIQDAEVRGS